jgi:hypothetical protein
VLQQPLLNTRETGSEQAITKRVFAPCYTLAMIHQCRILSPIDNFCAGSGAGGSCIVGIPYAAWIERERVSAHAQLDQTQTRRNVL